MEKRRGPKANGASPLPFGGLTLALLRPMAEGPSGAAAIELRIRDFAQNLVSFGTTSDVDAHPGVEHPRGALTDLRFDGTSALGSWEKWSETSQFSCQHVSLQLWIPRW